MRTSASHCSRCGCTLFLSGPWREAGCPVEFKHVCPGCGHQSRILVRLQPSFNTVPRSSRFDWHLALAQELYQSWARAAAAEADLLSHTPGPWEDLDVPEVRLWLRAYRGYLGRHAA